MNCYFPIQRPQFEMTMNAAAYGGPVVECEPDVYGAQVARRSEMVTANPGYYHACSDAALDAAWEATDLILTDMAASRPDLFTFERNGSARAWRDTGSGIEEQFRSGDIDTLPAGVLSPLDFVGRRVQEDIILLRGDDSGAAVCRAGHVCFASGWCLQDKLDRTFLDIHSEVPGFADLIGRASDMLMRRLKPGRAVMRWNWTISDSFDLDNTPLARARRNNITMPAAHPEVGLRCCFRVEKQTLTLLPRSRATLFTIHTFVNTIASVCDDARRRSLLRAALASMPPATVAYKNAQGYYDELLAYLDTPGSSLAD